jgi:hypothetical protein
VYIEQANALATKENIMKALLIKYHGPTNTKMSRLSVQSEGFKPEYEDREFDLEVYYQAHRLACRTFQKRFRMDIPEFALGVLPNGDYAAVLI